LEPHVPQEWWKPLFNELYLKTDGDVVENDLNTLRDVNYVIDAVALNKDDKIIDICCGQGRHSIEFSRRGFNNVVGVDQSEYLITCARNRSFNLPFAPLFFVQNAECLQFPPESFQCAILMGNSFGYFEKQQDDLALLKQIYELLSEKGRICIDIMDGDWIKSNFEPRSWEWIDNEHIACREREISIDKNRLISREIVMHNEKGMLADNFYAVRLYTKESIKDILDQAGFQSIRFHAQVHSESSRQQDLGMMENRILISASKGL
jgi:D-alanine-D-alanine ligase